MLVKIYGAATALPCEGEATHECAKQGGCDAHRTGGGQQGKEDRASPSYRLGVTGRDRGRGVSSLEQMVAEHLSDEDDEEFCNLSFADVLLCVM